MATLLWLLVLVLILAWLGGLAFSIGGGLIHLILVLAVVLIAYNLIVGQKRIP